MAASEGEHRRHGHGCGPRHWSAPVGALARADLHVHCGHIRVREITMGLRDPACLLSFLRPPGEQSLAVSRRAGFQTVLSPPSQAGGVSASVSDSGVLHPGGLFRPQASTTLRDGGCCDVALTCDACVWRGWMMSLGSGSTDKFVALRCCCGFDTKGVHGALSG